MAASRRPEKLKSHTQKLPSQEIEGWWSLTPLWSTTQDDWWPFGHSQSRYRNFFEAIIGGLLRPHEILCPMEHYWWPPAFHGDPVQLEAFCAITSIRTDIQPVQSTTPTFLDQADNHPNTAQGCTHFAVQHRSTASGPDASSRGRPRPKTCGVAAPSSGNPPLILSGLLP